MESNERKRNLVLVGVLALIVFVCVGTFSATAAIGYFIFGGSGGDARSVDIRIDEPDETPAPRRATATPAAPGQTPEAGSRATAVPDRPASAAAPLDQSETEKQLAQVIVPTRDLRELALRLRPGVEDVPEVIESVDYAVGDECGRQPAV